MNTSQTVLATPVLSDDSIRRVREATIQAAASSRPLLAATLGGNLTQIIAPLKIADFGGFQSFMTRYLSDLIEIDGSRVALNGQLWLRRPTARDIDGRGWINVLSLDGTLFWHLFANPTIPAFFAASARDQTLLVNREQSNQLVGATPFCKLTNQDYTRAAETLVKELPEPARQRAATLLTSTGASLDWMNFLKRESQELLHKWSQLRVETAFELLRKQLHAAGVTEPAYQTILSHLKIAQQASAAQRVAALTARNLSSVPVAKSNSGENSQHFVDLMRRVAHSVLETLNEQDLRSIKVPLGAVIDALNKR